MPITSRRRITAVLAALVVLLTACRVAPATPDEATSTSGTGSARDLLTRLAVVTSLGPIDGYQRGCGKGQACSFGAAWTDNSAAPGSHNGCDTRNDVLAAQLTHVSWAPGSHCVVSNGTLLDPYTGTTINFSHARAQAVQIDHIVPLALVWRLGANKWTQAERTTYANDESLVLLAVSGTENERKSDSGPSGYMPPNRGDWCQYATKFIQVLHAYSLPVLASDKAVLTRALSTCASN